MAAVVHSPGKCAWKGEHKARELEQSLEQATI